MPGVAEEPEFDEPEFEEFEFEEPEFEESGLEFEELDDPAFGVELPVAPGMVPQGPPPGLV